MVFNNCKCLNSEMRRPHSTIGSGIRWLQTTWRRFSSSFVTNQPVLLIEIALSSCRHRDLTSCAQTSSADCFKRWKFFARSPLSETILVSVILLFFVIWPLFYFYFRLFFVQMMAGLPTAAGCWGLQGRASNPGSLTTPGGAPTRRCMMVWRPCFVFIIILPYLFCFILNFVNRKLNVAAKAEIL